jgi:hypothetical protein
MLFLDQLFYTPIICVVRCQSVCGMPHSIPKGWEAEGRGTVPTTANIEHVSLIFDQEMSWQAAGQNDRVLGQ